MASQQVRAILGACLGGLLGLVLGGILGGFLVSPSRPVGEGTPAADAGVNPADGLKVVLQPVGLALDAGRFLFWSAMGGLMGAVAGAACVAGLATGQRVHPAEPSAPESAPRKGPPTPDG
jgi:hypothetical protein